MRQICVFLLLLMLSGCDAIGSRQTVVVNSTVPEISLPEKPQQELLTPPQLVEYNTLSTELREKLQNNDRKLKVYAQQLEDSVKVYNTYSQRHNAENQKWIDGTLGKAK